MTEQDLRAWLDAYGHGWEGRDPEAIAALFADDCLYWITPSSFGGPLAGRDAVLEYWRSATEGERTVSFAYELLAVEDGRGIARWWASVRDPKAESRLDGILIITLAVDGLCEEFREWWNEEASANGNGADDNWRSPLGELVESMGRVRRRSRAAASDSARRSSSLSGFGRRD